MSTWEGKSKGNKLGYRIFVWILARFGVTPAYLLLRLVVLYYFFFSLKSSRHLLVFYRRKLGFSLLKALLYLYKNYFRLGQSIIDKVVLMSGMPNKFSFHFDGEAHLRQMVSLEEGGILLSAHIGNWDIAGHLLKRLEARINIVIYDGEYQQIKDYLNSVTGLRAVNVIIIKNDLSHIYAINEALKNNELVCMHADRFIEGNKTLETTFCGDIARFPLGPFLLAATFKVPVSFVFAVKESNLHYHFFATDIKYYNQQPKNEQVKEMLVDFAEEMEKKVKQYPEQWFNYYDFWHREVPAPIQSQSKKQ